MATFYVFTSRQLLGQRFSEMLGCLFPEISETPWDWPELAESLAGQVERRGDAFVVYREDLDERVSVKDALVAQFGAALDDEIVEVHFGAGLHQVLHQRWASEPGRSASALSPSLALRAG